MSTVTTGGAAAPDAPAATPGTTGTRGVPAGPGTWRVTWHGVRTVATLELRQRVRSTRWKICLLYTSPSPRDRQKSRMPSSA